MIKKIYRLKESEVKKVLSYGKPFFSYGIVLNFKKNKLKHNRFAIVISGKSVKNNVTRNFYRRKFYNLISEKNSINLDSQDNFFGYDYVFVVKKQLKLDKKDNEILKNFEKDIKFLLNKKINIGKKS